MAITYIVGNPGSGKTYLAVYRLYEYFVLPKLPAKKFLGFELKRKIKNFDYLYCYTNINEFDFSIDERIIKFDFDLMYLNLSELYRLHSQGLSDTELSFKANELKLFKVMFVLDEVHNFFKEKDDKVTYLVAYLSSSFTPLKATSSVENTTISQSSSYEYKDVGLQVKLKPLIIDEFVHFDLHLIVEDLLDNKNLTPTTSKKELKSSYTLKKM